MKVDCFEEQQKHSLTERLLSAESKDPINVPPSACFLLKSHAASKNDLENPVCSPSDLSSTKETRKGVGDKSALSRLSRYLCAPMLWISMMANELDINFVFGIIIVYGISQGLGGSLHKVIIEFYWKDVQLAQPSSVQAYHGIIGIPLDIKPVWGLLTDVVPIAGYYRRPYFILSGGLGVMVYLIFLLGGKVPVPIAVMLLLVSAASSAMAEVTIDAVAAKQSRERPHLAADIQSLCYMSYSVGRLAGYSLSGVAVHTFGAQGSLSLLLIPPALLTALGILLQEQKIPKNTKDTQAHRKVLEATYKMWNALKNPLVWMPAFYMYISWAICPDISEGLFYYYTNSFHGLSLSTEFIGILYAIGSVGSFVGVIVYRNFLTNISFRWLLFWVQIVIAVFGMLDFVLVTKLNLRIGMSNQAFVIIDESFSRATDRLKYTPLFVLCAKLCPPGIEGTFFALLVSIENIGLRFSSWGGSAMLALLKITRDRFRHLWLAVLIRNILRILPVVMIFLLPNTTPDMTIV